MKGKYEIKDIIVPKEKRENVNDTILKLIKSNSKKLTKTDIYNTYTGNGGLHGLKREDFDNMHEFSEAKKEIEEGQFFTPPRITKFMVECIKPKEKDLIADLTCGKGDFFNWLPKIKNAYGNELDMDAYDVARYLYPKANLSNQDIRQYNPQKDFDIIFGNPPFNLKWYIEGEETFSQHYYIKKSFELLKTAGFLVLITPAHFLTDDFLDKSKIKEIDERFNYITQIGLPSDAFYNVGVQNFKTKIILLQKRSNYIEDTNFKPVETDNLFTLPEISEKYSNYIYQNFIKAKKKERQSVRSQLLLENIKKQKGQANLFKTKGDDIHSKINNREYSRRFQDKATKLLYDIRNNPKTNKYYEKCKTHVDKFLNQSKPRDMTQKKWDKRKLTENKVISYLKHYLAKQDEKEEDKIELVKNKYKIYYKAYSRAKKKELKEMKEKGEVIEMPIYEMVQDEVYPFEDKKYYNLIQRKIKEKKMQQKDLDDMPENKEIKDWLEDYSMVDYQSGDTIYLNDNQKQDLHKVMQKRYAGLNWEQGAGKTFAGFAWYHYMLETKNIRNVFIVAPAIAIRSTWNTNLKANDEDYIEIKSKSDVDKIKEGQVVIITFNRLSRQQDHIKNYIKRHSNKMALIVDESDSLTNETSKRTKATLSCFRQLDYKLLLTGTLTRNSINELYSQLELLYNNSYNMICTPEYKYTYSKKSNEINRKENDYQDEPFPAYRGNLLFKRCFSPRKTTVFGIKQDNQDIYNIKHLKPILNKSFITRDFEEVVGEKIYDIKTHTDLKQSDTEKNLYKKIMQEFNEMVHNYFKPLDNKRKENLINVMRQLRLLIKATSSPHLMEDYKGENLPNKYHKIFELVEDFSDRKVAIGSIFKDSAKDYYKKLRTEFFGRRVFLVTGDVPFKKRRNIVKQFEATNNGILVSTQQSLSSSISIPSCDRVIIESLLWNMPTISQYYFRFIRYNSVEDKEVHFVTYQNTIEQNLLGLLFTKEKINDFVKHGEVQDRADIFDKFDADINNILESIIEKERDEKGRVKLNWGKQKLVK